VENQVISSFSQQKKKSAKANFLTRTRQFSQYIPRFSVVSLVFIYLSPQKKICGHVETLVTNFIPNTAWLLPKFEHIGCHISRLHPLEINMYSCMLTNFAFLFLRGRNQMSHEGSGELLIELKTEICP